MASFVGYSESKVSDELLNIEFPLVVMYPTAIPGKIEKFGPYSLDVSIDAEPIEKIFPLVLISHGSGGSHLGYRNLAHYLASNGFIVGLPLHPFNNRNDNSLEGTETNLIYRPRHIQNAINWFFKSTKFKEILKADCVSIIGNSMGGYTALAIAGGVPTSLAHENVNNIPKHIEVVHDSRIKALVLLAPAAIWFRESNALNEVKCPILMLVGEKDEHTGPECPILLKSGKKEEYMPYGYHVQIILKGVSNQSKIQHRLVRNAGHFSFLSPFPEAMVHPGFPPSQDPLGFNRKDFHDELHLEILDFLLRETESKKWPY